MAEKSGSFWGRGPGLLLLFLLVVLGGTTAGSLALIHNVTHPARDLRTLDPADVMLRTEEVTFQSADGVPLSGWFVSGRPGGPVIILCHDLGSARSALLNSAAALSRTGYPLFLLDFRGHGLSGGNGSTLGMDERLDVLGAVTYLQTRRDVDTTRFGVWGIGMGAYAAALAGTENGAIVALALDSLYPDVEAQLDRLVRATVPPALHPLVPVVRLFYGPYFSFKTKGHSVSGALGGLAGRNLLFIAGLDVPERYQEEKALYASLPESPTGDKNFLELKSAVITRLYAEDKKTYDDALVNFFSTYLPKGSGKGTRAPKPLEVIER